MKLLTYDDWHTHYQKHIEMHPRDERKRMLFSFTLAELTIFAKGRSIPRVWRMNKEEMVEALIANLPDTSETDNEVARRIMIHGLKAREGLETAMKELHVSYRWLWRGGPTRSKIEDGDLLAAVHRELSRAWENITGAQAAISDLYKAWEEGFA